MSVDWNALLVSSRQGDERAREALFTALRVRLLAVAQYRLQKGSDALIEDLVQTTLELAFTRLSTVESNPHLFALEILRNKIGDHLRVRSRRTERQLSPTGTEEEVSGGETSSLVLTDPHSTEFEDRVEVADQLDRVRRAIQRLSPLCQALFLALLNYRTINEVWELAARRDPKLTRSTFDKRMFDCRKRLRAQVGKAL